MGRKSSQIVCGEAGNSGAGEGGALPSARRRDSDPLTGLCVIRTGSQTPPRATTELCGPVFTFTAASHDPVARRLLRCPAALLLRRPPLPLLVVSGRRRSSCSARQLTPSWSKQHQYKKEREQATDEGGRQDRTRLTAFGERTERGEHEKQNTTKHCGAPLGADAVPFSPCEIERKREAKRKMDKRKRRQVRNRADRKNPGRTRQYADRQRATSIHSQETHEQRKQERRDSAAAYLVRPLDPGQHASSLDRIEKDAIVPRPWQPRRGAKCPRKKRAEIDVENRTYSGRVGTRGSIASQKRISSACMFA